MPLFTNPAETVPVAPLEADVVPVIDTASVYVNSVVNDPVVSFIEGSPWTVTYYGQFIGSDDLVLNANDVNDPTLRQYQKVNNFEIRVRSGLEQITNPSLGTSKVTGTASIYPVLVPMVGDVFIAELGNNSFGVFEVTVVERKSMYKESVWDIEYTQTDYLRDDLLTRLESHVVSRLVFDVSYLGTDQSPLRTISQNDKDVTKESVISSLICRYYISFYNKDIETFLVPNDTGMLLYDPRLVSLWNSFITDSELGTHPRPRMYDVRDGKPAMQSLTIVEALMAQDLDLLALAKNVVEYVPVINYSADYQHMGLVSSGITHVVQPKGSFISAIAADGTYIANAEFYTRTAPDLPSFESVLNKAFRKEALTFSELKDIIDDMTDKSDIEKFYQIPILIGLMTISR